MCIKLLIFNLLYELLVKKNILKNRIFFNNEFLVKK